MESDDNRLKMNRNDQKEPGNFNGKNFFQNFSNNGKFHFSLWYFVIAIVVILALNSFLANQQVGTFVDYSQFKELIRNGSIVRVEITEKQLLGSVADHSMAEELRDKATWNTQLQVYRTTPVLNDTGLIALLDEYNVEYYALLPKEPGILSMLLSWIMPFAFLMLFWRFIIKRMGNMQKNVMSFNKSGNQIVAEGDTGVRFSDVAGVEESKTELEEVVDFLNFPDKYSAVGGRIPKGVLLVGPPGTGKTLLAKAVAGESGVPFFRMSGADFVEMFVGVGAARVRDLFKQAREKAPCIIFIDELDAVGKSRTGMVGGNDEREQTLNQLLVEMDGFDSKSGVILLGATNRPETLDTALLRPGRFDRQVLVDRPDLEGRLKILQIHSKDVKMDDDIDLEQIARSTVGLVGADLANIVNEAALLAVRNKRTRVVQADLTEAIEKAIAGLEKKSRVMNAKERERVAYHEMGHALTAYVTPGADPVEKVSIVPRGMSALGYTLQTPAEDRYLQTEEELIGKIDVLLGGRAAEEIVFGSISTGASNDISRASDLVRKMITEYGMSEKFRNVALPSGGPISPFLNNGVSRGNREYSEETQNYIDSEISRMIDQRYQFIKSRLTAKLDTLKALTHKLLESEVIIRKEFLEIVQA